MKKEPARIGGTFLRRLAFVYSLWVYYVIGKNEMYPLYWTPSKEGTFCVIRLNLS